ncbi:hypothetical protein GALMADRAFT_221038 [Galerina marginata CBS 339.88]|uniref:Polysaccharide lyase family 14 protein n=1 Tax=Galerina marginata (strain CBS 339.88) TaxID=685588 RepID=A0A067TL50_GALM3|nr:hypothetical protein GALMADRAFT_221038 [Galerina marginata CBS 339.88]
MAPAALSLTLLILCTTPPLTSAGFPHLKGWQRSSSSSSSRWTRLWRRGSSSSTPPTRTVPPEGFYVPMSNGGSMLTSVPNTFPPGQGEPVNAILSGSSDAQVLVDQETDGGMRNYFLSFGFSGECLGQHSGSDQAVDLGDGDGFQNETSVIRWNYGDAQLGSCQETIQGGNHFRYWVQNGPAADSGAIFMAVSYEMPISQDHDIIVNGYNLGRDWLIGNITHQLVPTPNITNGTSYSGTTAWANYTYQTDITYRAGLLENTNFNINHNFSVGVDGVNASDGLVAVLDVKITGVPAKS